MIPFETLLFLLDIDDYTVHHYESINENNGHSMWNFIYTFYRNETRFGKTESRLYRYSFQMDTEFKAENINKETTIKKHTLEIFKNRFPSIYHSNTIDFTDYNFNIKEVQDGTK